MDPGYLGSSDYTQVIESTTKSMVFLLPDNIFLVLGPDSSVVFGLFYQEKFLSSINTGIFDWSL